MKLADLVGTYLQFKRSLGMCFRTQAVYLHSFARAAGDVDVGDVTPQIVSAFLAGVGPITATWHLRFAALNGLYRFAIARDIVAASPLPTIHPKIPPSRIAYIYSVEEIRRLIAATESLTAWNSPLQATTYRMLVLLLYATAMRIGEALSLKLKDVDLPERLLIVRNTKFYKTRYVPIGPKIENELRGYMAQRCQLPLPEGRESALFAGRTGRRWSRNYAGALFGRIRRVAQIHRDGGIRSAPCIHDIRHTAITHQVIHWYRAGEDVQRLLLPLATYVGHVGIASTQRYLTMTPELCMRQASASNNTPWRRHIMSERSSMGPWVRRFLLEHLVAERNLSRNTQASYRDTMTLFLPFVSVEKRTPLDRLAIEDISRDIVLRFLDHVENERRCSATSRNQRLAAIRSLAKFIGMRSPQHIAWSAEMRSVPFKKTAQGTFDYLDKQEMSALLNVPDRRTKQGARDYGLLLFLYNTGARVEETAQVRVADLSFRDIASVRLMGKGSKTRSCPLWPNTVAVLKPLVAGLGATVRVFRSRRNEPLTRFGIYNVVKVAAEHASTTTTSLLAKRISPHTIRHTAACHLLRAGVDINTIRAWLGHVSIDTTNIYAEVDIEMKAKALGHCEVAVERTSKRWRHEPSLMEFLRAL